MGHIFVCIRSPAWCTSPRGLTDPCLLIGSVSHTWLFHSHQARPPAQPHRSQQPGDQQASGEPRPQTVDSIELLGLGGASFILLLISSSGIAAHLFRGDR